jgi:hypothetical protein
MDSTNALSRLTDQPALDAVATPLSQAIRGPMSRRGQLGSGPRTRCMASGSAIRCTLCSRIFHWAHGQQASCLMRSRR